MGQKSMVQAGPGLVLIEQKTQVQMKERLSRVTAEHNKPLKSQIDVRDLDDVMEQAELAGCVFSVENLFAELLFNPRHEHNWVCVIEKIWEEQQEGVMWG